MNERIGVALVKIAAVYMVIGLAIGLFVAISKHMELMTVHSHVLLLGWVTMALAGLVYAASRACAASRLAKWHFWLHNIGMPVMMISLALYELGNARAEMFLGIGSFVIAGALLLFTINVLSNCRAETFLQSSRRTD